MPKKSLPSRRPSHATVVAYLALFITLGGSSYAAVELRKNSVRSKHIKNGQVKRADLGKSAVDSSRVANGSLLAADFAAGQLPAGPKGPKGDAGAPGPAGPAGSDAVIAKTYLWSASTFPMPAPPGSGSQVNLLSPGQSGETGGVLTVDRPAQVHAQATAVVRRKTAGAGGRAICYMRMNGQALSSGSYESFADAGQDAEGQPAVTVMTLPMVGVANVEPGTYNVGVLCLADRDDLAELRGVDLSVVAYAK